MSDRHAKHQSTMLEIEGKIFGKTVSVLIKTGFSFSYIFPYVIGKCPLKKEK